MQAATDEELVGRVGAGDTAGSAWLRLKMSVWGLTGRGPDRIRQHWESSLDAGKTWTTVFDGTYVKKGA